MTGSKKGITQSHARRLAHALTAPVRVLPRTPDDAMLKLAFTDRLEEMVDRMGLGEVLALLSDVCDAKADHVAGAWADHTLADAWSAARDRLSEWAGDEIIARLRS